MQIQLSVELIQHASGMELTASKIHAKFMPLTLNAMPKQNVFGMQQLQPSVLLMFAQIIQMQQNVELM
jgi:hypothetical protein